MTIVADYVRQLTRWFHGTAVCSACHRPRTADRRLVSGPACYICEACVGEAAARRASVDQTARCSFCWHTNRPAIGSWPELSICGDCAELAENIFAHRSDSHDQLPDR